MKKMVSVIVSIFIGITAITIGNLGTYYIISLLNKMGVEPYYPDAKTIMVFVIYNILCATVCALITYAIINFKSKKHRKNKTDQKSTHC